MFFSMIMTLPARTLCSSEGSRALQTSTSGMENLFATVRRGTMALRSPRITRLDEATVNRLRMPRGEP